MIKNILLTVCICLITFTVKSQENPEEYWGSWLTYFGTNTLSEKLSIHTELELNHFEVFNNYQQFWAIAGLNYHITKDASVTFGYGYFNFDNQFGTLPNEENTFEHRLFEQFTHNYKLGKLKLQNRYRLENRFFTRPIKSTVQRVRVRLQLTYPINRHWFINASDEVFFDIQEPIFNQNRIFGAVGYKVTPSINVQAGYLKLHFTGSDLDRLQIVLNIDTDLRKKTKDNIGG